MTTVLGEIVESAPAWKVGRVSKFKKSLRPDGSHHVDVGGIEHRNQQSSTPYSMFSTAMVLGPMKITPSTFEFGFGESVYPCSTFRTHGDTQQREQCRRPHCVRCIPIWHHGWNNVRRGVMVQLLPTWSADAPSEGRITRSTCRSETNIRNADFSQVVTSTLRMIPALR